MSKVKRSTWLATALLLALACPAFQGAAGAASGKKKDSRPHIVLIGISDYKDPQIKPRKHAEDDAKALYDLCTSKDFLPGVDPANVRLLLGKVDDKRPSKEATRANILEAMHWLASARGAKRDDLVVFAFFGEGASLGERGDRTCYFASDSTLKGRVKDAVDAADIAQEFDKLKSKSVCVLLDVNFKGFDAGKESIPDASLGENPYKEFLGDDKTEEHNPLPGRVIFMASNGLVAGPDLDKHGLFAEALLAGLKGDADKEGYEADGLVTTDEMTTYLNKQIPALKRKHDKIDKERRHDHFIIGGAASHFVLTTNPAAYKKNRARLEKFDAEFKDQFGKAIREEGDRLLGRMPKLEALRSLRKEYQKLVEGTVTADQFARTRLAILKQTELPRSASLRFAGKVLQAVQLVDREYVKKVDRGQLVTWAIRGLYQRIDEQLPEDLVERLDNLKDRNPTPSTLGTLLSDARGRLGQREDLDKHKDVDIALQRMLAHLDPYTTYIDPETVARFESEYKGQFTGIGVQIRKDNATDMLQIVTPIKGSPSYRIPLLAGDLITTITREVDSDGNPLDKPEVLHTKDMTLSEAVKKILGKAATKVRLTIKREGSEQPFEVEITRGRIELESVFGVKRKADDSWDFWLDSENRIGYIRLSNFAKRTADDLTEVVRRLRRQGMKALVLDLRFNPGGLLRSAHEISDLFIRSGRIVEIRRPLLGEVDPMDARPGGIGETGFQMVCLVNGYSASASEIVSAALQDHKRARIMGERSYGKGSVQNIQEFDGGQLKLTIASFWRPSGKNLNKSSTSGKEDDTWGVTPDKGYGLELSRKEREDLAEHLRNTEIIPRRDRPAKEKAEFKDRQLDLALKFLRDEVRASR